MMHFRIFCREHSAAGGNGRELNGTSGAYSAVVEAGIEGGLMHQQGSSRVFTAAAKRPMP